MPTLRSTGSAGRGFCLESFTPNLNFDYPHPLSGGLLPRHHPAHSRRRRAVQSVCWEAGHDAVGRIGILLLRHPVAVLCPLSRITACVARHTNTHCNTNVVTTSPALLRATPLFSSCLPSRFYTRRSLDPRRGFQPGCLAASTMLKAVAVKGDFSGPGLLQRLSCTTTARLHQPPIDAMVKAG